MEHQNLPKIYSSKAILGFSIFLSTLFGGVLLYHNLKDLGKKKEANIILAFSILFTILSIVVVNIPETPKSSFAYLCGLVGGGILSYFFVPKYITDESNYPKKPIWKPLIIGVIILVLVVFLMIYANENSL
jgi:peptidoglycan/LPS O-acetylase OafA/YrhL